MLGLSAATGSGAAVRGPIGHLRWAVALSALAGGLAARLWLVAVVMSTPVKRRLLPDLAIPLRLRLGGRARWFWFSDTSELRALEEIFSEGEYEAVDGGSPAVIVDLGANVGQAALWFRSRFPDARLLCVEPDPRTFDKLSRNVGHDPLVTLRQAAITAQDGLVGLERAPQLSWATRVTGAGAPDAIQVPGVSLQTLLDDNDLAHVDLLKVDIEGLEHEALASSPALARVALVIGELHADLIGMTFERALEDMRLCGGFDRSELSGDIFVLARRPLLPTLQT
jgi:FkbM family methyltransferase